MRVVIGGAGVAALEAAAALRCLAADRVSITLIAPDHTFLTRALQPFLAFGVDPPRGVPVEVLADRLDADLVDDRVAWVDRVRRSVHCRSGVALGFDALVLGVGAAPHVRFPRALTLHEGAFARLAQLVSRITAGDVRRVAFIAPERMAWPLPLYETALMTAALGREHELRLSLTVVTGETAPLQAFGDPAGAEMQGLLDEHDIELFTAARCQVPAAGRVVLPGEHRELVVDRVVALPELMGPHIRGLPSAPYGVDRAPRRGAPVRLQRRHARRRRGRHARQGGRAVSDRSARARRSFKNAPTEVRRRESRRSAGDRAERRSAMAARASRGRQLAAAGPSGVDVAGLRVAGSVKAWRV